jgi:hypothetical protein
MATVAYMRPRRQSDILDLFLRFSAPIRGPGYAVHILLCILAKKYSLEDFITVIRATPQACKCKGRICRRSMQVKAQDQQYLLRQRY